MGTIPRATTAVSEDSLLTFRSPPSNWREAEDGDVGLDDHDIFCECLAGPGITPTPEFGRATQFDSADFDGDVDWTDDLVIQNQSAGPNEYADGPSGLHGVSHRCYSPSPPMLRGTWQVTLERVDDTDWA